MIVRGPRSERDFTILSNSVLQDTRLSYRAAGLLVSLLSRPPGWTVSANRLVREGKEGRDAIRTALNELETEGYLQRQRVRNDDGTFAQIATVYETPIDKPTDISPEPENPAPESQALKKEQIKKELPDSFHSSGDSSRNQSVSTEGDSLNSICREYWDLHVEERQGLTPPLNWNQLRAVTRGSLRAGCTPDEIVAALMQHDRAKATTASIVAKVGEARRRAAEAPTGPAIHPAALHAYQAIEAAYRDRGRSLPHQKPFGEVVARGSLLQVLEILLRPGFGMTTSEVVARCCLFFKHAGMKNPTVDDLIDPDMPISPAAVAGRDDLVAVATRAWKMGVAA